MHGIKIEVDIPKSPHRAHPPRCHHRRCLLFIIYACAYVTLLLIYLICHICIQCFFLYIRVHNTLLDTYTTTATTNNIYITQNNNIMDGIYLFLSTYYSINNIVAYSCCTFSEKEKQNKFNIIRHTHTHTAFNYQCK